jgi:carbon starvation protein
MNSLALAAISCAALYLGYRVYGNALSRLWDVQPERRTPAHELYDGVDYVPARHWIVLFGHHFASIAGAGPIIGPALACAMWGWAPALLWLVLGSIFLGAVHDFSSLMASLRSQGKSIAEIAETHLGHRVRLIFGAFLWLALVLVVAVFAQLAAQTFVMKPQMVIPTFGLIGLALLVGVMMYTWKLPTWLGTVVGVGLLFGLLAIGYRVPVELPWGANANMVVWMVVLLVYSYFASILPVNILLQPRDYLSTFLLYSGVLAGYVGLLLTRPELEAPAVIGFSSGQGPLWPMLFVIIACGAISGFHSLVASGTTAKQLATEADAKKIGYGAMIVESTVGVMALVAVAAGLHWGAGADSYGAMLKEKGPLLTFATGYAALSKPLLGSVGALVALTMLNAFVLTTLDTATRITRYIGEEFFGEGLGMRWLRNRFLSTLIVVGCAFYLALGPFQTVWPVFGSANQLIGALALLVVSVVLKRLGRPVIYTLGPAVFMLVTTMAALVYQGYAFFTGGKTLLAAISFALLVLAVMMVADSIRAVRRGKPEAGVGVAAEVGAEVAVAAEAGS